MTDYVKNLWWRDMPQEKRWRYIAEAFYGKKADDSLVQLAIARLENGDVTQTIQGICVRVRPDLGDDPTVVAYWPKQPCSCESMTSRGKCSHAIAAKLFKVDPKTVWDRIDLQSYADQFKLPEGWERTGLR